jgi:uncharacterized linocin/CFP29 family protein
MSDFAPALTADQWDRIRQIVHDEALRARVAASFLPLYGPIPGATVAVPVDILSYESPTEPDRRVNQRMMVNDYDTLRLASVSVNVYLKNHMLVDPELAAATIMFIRAAKIVARVEDSLIFNGKEGNNQIVGTTDLQSVFEVGGADDYRGLVDYGGRPPNGSVRINYANPNEAGPAIFTAVVEAIGRLERRGHYKSYALVLATDLFTAINRPIPNSMVLPADSIPPLLDGPLLRASSLQDGHGLVISLQGNPAEIVVGSDISVRYLQGTLDGMHAFRVSERLVLRVKEPTAIVLIESGTQTGTRTATQTGTRRGQTPSNPAG